jgi:hypothetical protein
VPARRLECRIRDHPNIQLPIVAAAQPLTTGTTVISKPPVLRPETTQHALQFWYVPEAAWVLSR